MGIITTPAAISVYHPFPCARRVIGEVPLESIFKGIFPFLLSVIAGVITHDFPTYYSFSTGSHVLDNPL
ncbi:MAG: hypothetical protein JRF50_07345 [Deltaproteobacteria bacterium]|nr:hypothetical protein [Deltaproteobacteria bacterium]